MFKFISIFIFFSSLYLNATENIFDKGIDFKEGIVHYSVTGSISGSKTMYIKDYGQRRVIYTNTENRFMRKGNSSDRLKYITPKWIYEIDLKKRLTTKLPNLKYLLLKKYSTLSKKKQKIVFKNLNKKLIQDGKDTILGYQYKLESIDGVVTYTAKKSDLILKTETSILGYNQTIIATKIEKKSIKVDIFTLPNNLKIIDTSKQHNELEQKADKIINSLLFASDMKKESYTLDNTKENFHNIIEQTAHILSKL